MIPVATGVDLTENPAPLRRSPWAKSPAGSTASGHGRGGPPRPFAVHRRSAIRRQPGDRPVLGPTGPGAAPRPGRLAGPLARPADPAPHRRRDRGPRAEPAPGTGRVQ